MNEPRTQTQEDTLNQNPQDIHKIRTPRIASIDLLARRPNGCRLLWRAGHKAEAGELRPLIALSRGSVEARRRARGAKIGERRASCGRPPKAASAWGRCRGRPLRLVADRLLNVACAMLRFGTTFRPRIDDGASFLLCGGASPRRYGASGSLSKTIFVIFSRQSSRLFPLGGGGGGRYCRIRRGRYVAQWCCNLSAGRSRALTIRRSSFPGAASATSCWRNQRSPSVDRRKASSARSC